MMTQTSLVAEQIRLQDWAEQIKDCQSRPIGMSVESWCQQNGITKANYYYRLRRVRKACLAHVQSHEPKFVELPMPAYDNNHVRPHSNEKSKVTDVVAILRGPNNISLEIFSTATPELVDSLIGAFAYAK